MTVITARITVNSDGSISGRAPAQVPAGQHDVRLDLPLQALRLLPSQRFDARDMPSHDMGKWPAGTTLSREEIYRDDGR
jgi:hypothetical protein